MNEQIFLDWINSLNPIVIDVDENGDIVDESQLNQLTDRIEAEVREIKGDK